MPISDDFILKHVGKEYLIIPLLDGNVDFSKVHNVSETGAFIYERLKENKSLEEIATAMMAEYEVTYDIVCADIKEFIEELKKRGIYYD